MKVSCLFVTAVFFTALPLLAAQPPNEEEKRHAIFGRCSIIQLIAEPRNFDGQAVGVEGYLSTGYEDSRLYLTRDDADYVCQPNSVNVTFAKQIKMIPSNQKHSLQEFDHKRVFVIGRFNATQREVQEISQISLARCFYPIKKPHK
jgi:hypothetical protein